METVNGDVKSWLHKQLSEEREIQLTIRLGELGQFAENEILTDKEINRIKETRHYLVHLDERRKQAAYSAKELVEINDGLCLLFFNVLKRLIFDGKDYPRKRKVKD